jgi:hypothetical protein
MPGMRVVYARVHSLHFTCILVHSGQNINIQYKYILDIP